MGPHRHRRVPAWGRIRLTQEVATRRPGSGSRPGSRASLHGVGSKGSKPRKPRRSQHLPKVGTATENQRALHEERAAVFDNVGLGGVETWTKVALAVLAVLILVVGVVAFIALD